MLFLLSKTICTFRLVKDVRREFLALSRTYNYRIRHRNAYVNTNAHIDKVMKRKHQRDDKFSSLISHFQRSFQFVSRLSKIETGTTQLRSTFYVVKSRTPSWQKFPKKNSMRKGRIELPTRNTRFRKEDDTQHIYAIVACELLTATTCFRRARCYKLFLKACSTLRPRPCRFNVGSQWGYVGFACGLDGNEYRAHSNLWQL